MSPSDKLRALLDERGIKYVIRVPSNDTTWEHDGTHFTAVERFGKLYLQTSQGPLTPEQAVAATMGEGMTLDEATEYAEKFMSDYAKVLLESTLYVERDEPTDQHAFNVAERKEAQMARTLAEALATAGVGTCKLVDNDSGPDMHCTACGRGVDDEYRYFMDSWGYSRCPHCGARIIEEETE